MRPSRSDRHRVHAVELAGPFAEAAELADVVHLAVENHHAVIVQAVGDENPAVRQKRHVLRLAEVRAVLARHVLLAERLQQLAAVVREDVDLLNVSLMTQTRCSGSYGLMRSRCGPGPAEPSQSESHCVQRSLTLPFASSV